MLGWPKVCQLAQAFLWECSCKLLQPAQLLGQFGIFLTMYGRAAGLGALGFLTLEAIGGGRPTDGQGIRADKGPTGGGNAAT